jgi:hypothetical protein
MKRYRGIRDRSAGAAQVFILDSDDPQKCAALPPRNDLLNHSPDGFQWGYSGSGPAQLALALLCDHYADDKLAELYHQDLKAAWVAGIHTDTWTLTSEELELIVDKIRKNRGLGT